MQKQKQTNKNQDTGWEHLEEQWGKTQDVTSVYSSFRADYFLNSCEPLQLASFPSLNDMHVILNKDFCVSFLLVCMHAYMHVCSYVYQSHMCLRRSNGSVGFPETGVIVCEPPCRCWQTNLGPPKLSKCSYPLSHLSHPIWMNFGKAFPTQYLALSLNSHYWYSLVLQ